MPYGLTYSMTYSTTIIKQISLAEHVDLACAINSCVKCIRGVYLFGQDRFKIQWTDSKSPKDLQL